MCHSPVVIVLYCLNLCVSVCAYLFLLSDAEKNPDIMNTYLLKCLENLIQLLNT